MPKKRRTFSWIVTRLLFTTGTIAIFSGIAWYFSGSYGPTAWIIVLVGVALVAVSTRGPWDSESSGRNRSALRFHARPEHK